MAEHIVKPDLAKADILLIYTGGTIGMVEDPLTGHLYPFNFQRILECVPEIKRLNIRLDAVSLEPSIDSAEMHPAHWAKMVRLIADNYERYHGFVILHGTDTMAYTASALSFMLENLAKPVILTGSQLPIGVLRTDGKDNLLTALEIAAEKEGDKPMVQEVCIFFERVLLRGNRTSKVNAEYFNAFKSVDYPNLAHVGVHIKYDKAALYRHSSYRPLQAHEQMSTDVVVLKMFPGISEQVVRSVLGIEGLKAVVLETFGMGNTPTAAWFMHALREASDRGVVIVNITQCAGGSVDMQKYKSGTLLKNAGVISGYDSTTEAALTKLMYLFGLNYEASVVRSYMACCLKGEIGA